MFFHRKNSYAATSRKKKFEYDKEKNTAVSALFVLNTKAISGSIANKSEDEIFFSF